MRLPMWTWLACANLSKERSTPCILNQSLFLQLTKEQYWLWTCTCLCGCLFLPAWALGKIRKKMSKKLWAKYLCLSEFLWTYILNYWGKKKKKNRKKKKKGRKPIAYYCLFTTYSVIKILHFGLISSLLSHVCTILYLSGRNQKWPEKSGN